MADYTFSSKEKQKITNTYVSFHIKMSLAHVKVVRGKLISPLPLEGEKVEALHLSFGKYRLCDYPTCSKLVLCCAIVDFQTGGPWPRIEHIEILEDSSIAPVRHTVIPARTIYSDLPNLISIRGPDLIANRHNARTAICINSEGDISLLNDFTFVKSFSWYTFESLQSLLDRKLNLRFKSRLDFLEFVHVIEHVSEFSKWRCCKPCLQFDFPLAIYDYKRFNIAFYGLEVKLTMLNLPTQLQLCILSLLK